MSIREARRRWSVHPPPRWQRKLDNVFDLRFSVTTRSPITRQSHDARMSAKRANRTSQKLTPDIRITGHGTPDTGHCTTAQPDNQTTGHWTPDNGTTGQPDAGRRHWTLDNGTVGQPENPTTGYQTLHTGHRTLDSERIVHALVSEKIAVGHLRWPSLQTSGRTDALFQQLF